MAIDLSALRRASNQRFLSVSSLVFADKRLPNTHVYVKYVYVYAGVTYTVTLGRHELFRRSTIYMSKYASRFAPVDSVGKILRPVGGIISSRAGRETADEKFTNWKRASGAK